MWCWGAYSQGRQSNVPTQVSGCVQQTKKPPEARGFVTAPRDRTQHFAEAGRARAQAVCACQAQGSEPDDNCIDGQDLSPNPTCLSALAQDQGRYWDCRALSLWEEVACYTPASCVDGAAALPACPPPPTCNAALAPSAESYCRRRTCALDQEQPLTREQVCDGVTDCTDGSDERNCEPSMPFFECAQSTIPLKRMSTACPTATTAPTSSTASSGSPLVSFQQLTAQTNGLPVAASLW